jgi:hypothetical protein
MEKQTIKQQLVKEHTAFADYVLTLSEADFNFALPEKWNAGEHLQHILLSVTRLNSAICNPKYILPIEEVEPKRAAMNYDTFAKVYIDKIKGKGLKAPPPFIPERINIEQRQQLINNVQAMVAELCLKLDTYSEQELDALTLPHPAMGRLSLREMMYFTIQHAGHHYTLTKQYIK